MPSKEFILERNEMPHVASTLMNHHRISEQWHTIQQFTGSRRVEPKWLPHRLRLSTIQNWSFRRANINIPNQDICNTRMYLTVRYVTNVKPCIGQCWGDLCSIRLCNAPWRCERDNHSQRACFAATNHTVPHEPFQALPSFLFRVISRIRKTRKSERLCFIHVGFNKNKQSFIVEYKQMLMNLNRSDTFGASFQRKLDFLVSTRPLDLRFSFLWCELVLALGSRVSENCFKIEPASRLNRRRNEASLDDHIHSSQRYPKNSSPEPKQRP